MQGPIGVIFSERGSVQTIMVLHTRKGQGGSIGRVGVAPHGHRNEDEWHVRNALLKSENVRGCECFVPFTNVAFSFDEVHKKMISIAHSSCGG